MKQWLKPFREAALKRAIKKSAGLIPHLKVGANKSLLKQAEGKTVRLARTDLFGAK